MGDVVGRLGLRKPSGVVALPLGLRRSRSERMRWTRAPERPETAVAKVAVVDVEEALSWRP